MTTFLVIIGILLMLYGFIAMFSGMYRRSLEKNNERTDGVPKLPAWRAALLIGSLTFLLGLCVVQIKGQEVGVMYTPSGIVETPLHSGWHLVAPWNKVYRMDKTVWVYTFAQTTTDGNTPNSDAIWAPTSDAFKLGYDISVTWRIDPEQAPWVYANISEQDGSDEARYKWIENNIIRAYTKSALTTVTKNYNVIEAYSIKRDEIQQKTFELLRGELENRKLILEAVNIREVHYNKEYEAAINKKKLAEQEALRLVDVTKQKAELLTQAKIDKDIKIQEAEGEAKALLIKGNAINTNPQIIALEWISAWEAGGSQVPKIISDSKGSMFMLDVNQLK